MAKPSYPRARRLAETIRRLVGEWLEAELADQPGPLVTVTDVRVTGDAQHASVFYTVFGEESEVAASAAALESAKGVLRAEVGKQLGVRHVPTLEFIHDALPESARHIDDLLEKVRESDAAVAASASGATYAGDADPYRKPTEPADDETDETDG